MRILRCFAFVCYWNFWSAYSIRRTRTIRFLHENLEAIADIFEWCSNDAKDVIFRAWQKAATQSIRYGGDLRKRPDDKTVTFCIRVTRDRFIYSYDPESIWINRVFRKKCRTKFQRIARENMRRSVECADAIRCFCVVLGLVWSCLLRKSFEVSFCRESVYSGGFVLSGKNEVQIYSPSSIYLSIYI